MSKPFVGLSQRSSPIRFLGLVLLWCFLALVFLLYTLHNYAMIEQAPTDLNKLYDFKLFYSSVLDFFSGGKLYQPSATLPFERVLYSSSNNSPVGALVFVPLSRLPVTLAGDSGLFFRCSSSCAALFTSGKFTEYRSNGIGELHYYF